VARMGRVYGKPSSAMDTSCMADELTRTEIEAFQLKVSY
jgi:hypothetical protein